jgi:hypothetical protein
MTEAEKEHFEERAAILEFEAGYSREEAEKEALRMVKAFKQKTRCEAAGLSPANNLRGIAHDG